MRWTDTILYLEHPAAPQRSAVDIEGCMEKSRPAQRRPRIEELEPRILYSADVSPLAAAPLIAEQRSIDSAGEFVSRSSVETSAPVAAHASHELVFLDSDIPSYAQLIDDMRNQATDQRKIEVFLLDGNTNGIKQISAVLASQTDINAIHLISHGADGQLKLGATTLNFDSLLGNAAKIKAWGPSLGEGADLLVYGCNVAQHPDGKALIDALSRLTGANVAASDDLTGSVTLGGDWTLEYETGEINTPLAVPDEDQARWAYTLAGPLPNSAPDGADSTVSTVEDNPYTFASADFGFTDASDTPPNALSGVRIATLPTAGELTLAGVAVSVGQTVSAAEIDSGKLQYAAPTNANGAAYANFSFQVQDDGGTANGGTDVDPLPNKITIDVTPVNDEPVLSGANNFGSINEDATSNPGTLVSALIAGHVTDVDPAAVAGIAVTCVDNSNGAWQYSINGGSTWNNFNAPTESIARLLSADPNNYVRFVPTANWNGTVNNGLTFRAWDGASGTSGGTDDTGFRSVMDSFAAVSYGNNNGTNNWTTAWAENDGNGGGASSGSIKVSGENMFFKADNAGDGIYREADLSGASSATLSFSYNNHLNDTGIIALQVSNDGGGNYTTLTTFTKSGNSGAGY